MDPELKKKWVDALRSGRYNQTIAHLKVVQSFHSGEETINPGYCCLGVLCEVAGVEWKPGYQKSKVTCSAVVPEGDVITNFLPKSLGIDSDTQWKLADFNDKYRWPFEKIADWVDATL